MKEHPICKLCLELFEDRIKKKISVVELVTKERCTWCRAKTNIGIKEVKKKVAEK